MKVIKPIDIWPGKNNGFLVEKTAPNGSTYDAIMHKEEWELECMLLAIENEGITDLDQVDELRKLIENYGSLKYSLGCEAADSNNNY
jgi:hypothetical protein